MVGELRDTNLSANFIPANYRGMERFDARKLIVADLEAQGLLVKVDKHKLKVPRGDRTGTVIEPMLTDQWFMAVNKPAPENHAFRSEERRVGKECA